MEKDLYIEKVLAEIEQMREESRQSREEQAKLKAEAEKLHFDAKKAYLEFVFYPMVVTAGLFGAIAAFTKAFL